MIQVGLFVKDTTTNEFHRVELFTDEKISVNSTIQNINDISKVYTDFSQTFTVPASIKNNQIFKHWYDSSNNDAFSVKVKVDAYIELDTILFRNGKIQLEGANIKNERPQSYSLTFIGNLVSLKDKFAGLYLKDLDTSSYDFVYTPTFVINKVTTLTTTPATPDISFPLISSARLWNYGQGGDDDITQNNHPIRYNELFPALRLKAILRMIESKFSIDLGITSGVSSFLNDGRFTNTHMLLKNADTFEIGLPKTKILLTSQTSAFNYSGFMWDFTDNKLSINTPVPLVISGPNIYGFYDRSAVMKISSTTAGIDYFLLIYINGSLYWQSPLWSSSVTQTSIALPYTNNLSNTNKIEYYISAQSVLTYTSELLTTTRFYNATVTPHFLTYTYSFKNTTGQTTTADVLQLTNLMPNIKIEDFFSGLLKMFNLTCYSDDGINYVIEQLENYYNQGVDRNLTKYILQDNIDLARVKTYKKINFKYQKSDSLINVAFKSTNGIEYGDLYYSDNADGEEYNIELPFEDLNFENLHSMLQVGFCLKTDYNKYIPKPIILYEYDPSALVNSGSSFHMKNALTGNGTAYTNYRAFGQEYYNGAVTYSLNFPLQQSTLTNLPVDRSLYNQYYQNYFANIFNFKARLYKCNAILPTSILTSLKLNDNIIIRDIKYIINNMVTDLTTGEVKFELLTDIRE